MHNMTNVIQIENVNVVSLVEVDDNNDFNNNCLFKICSAQSYPVYTPIKCTSKMNNFVRII